MTTGTTIRWMKEKGYMDKWLVPQNGLNAGTCFEGRSVGNSHELMPLDMSLNTDIKYAHTRHVALTRHLGKDDARKFCNHTPNRIASGIKRIVEGRCPSSE